MGRRVEIRELDPDTTQTLQVTSDNKYLWDGAKIAERRTADGGTVLQRYYDQGFVDSDGTVLFYTRDHLGSIRELTDGTQAIRARYDYDPYGRMTQLQGDRTSPFGYTGDFWHAPSGLDLTLFRAYDPSLGRWLSRDPIEELGGVNLYAYVENNPINFMDRFGLDAGQTSPAGPIVFIIPLVKKHVIIDGQTFVLVVTGYDPCHNIVYYTLIREFPGASNPGDE